MRILINGDPREIEGEITVSELVGALGLTPELVAVELNDGLVARSERDATRLSEGDRVEIVTLVGGG